MLHIYIYLEHLMMCWSFVLRPSMMALWTSGSSNLDHLPEDEVKLCYITQNTFFSIFLFSLRYYNGDEAWEHCRYSYQEWWPQHKVCGSEVHREAIPHLRHQVWHQAVVCRDQLESTRCLDVQRFLSKVSKN